MKIEEQFIEIKGREGPNIEYKLCRSKLSRDLWETVSAFSNEGGGLIRLGYEENDGKYMPVGVKNPHKMLDEFTSLVGQKFNYCPIVKAEILDDDNKPIILIEVEESPKYQKPIYIKDAGPIKGGFRRVGASDIRLTDSDVARYYKERTGSLDAQIIPDTNLKDIDVKAVEAFRNLRKLIKPDAPELLFNDAELLKSYNLLSPDGKNLNAAGVLLFGQERVVKRHFPSVRLDIIRIKGTEWGKDKDPFLSRDLTGNLLGIWSSAMDVLDRFFLVPFKLNESMARSEDNAHSKALREALTNLLMHRNYLNYSPAQVQVYNDRIEFYNPGYSLKDIKLYDSPGSMLRNPLIADVFYDIGWAEAKGTGIKTTINDLKAEGYPLPEYLNNIKSDTFTFILKHPTDQVTPQVTLQVTPQVEMMDRIALTLNYCETPRSLKELMAFLNLRDRKHFMEKVLNPLLEKRYLKRTIPDKPRSRLQKYVAVEEKEKVSEKSNNQKQQKKNESKI